MSLKSILFSASAKARAERLVGRFRKDEDGATAIEFAIVAIPFFTLLFGILELAIVFFISSSLAHSVSEAGRILRVGNFQACGGADEFKALVCKNMNGMGNCWKNVRIDVLEGGSFKAITMPPPPDPQPKIAGQTGSAAVPQTPNGQFDTNVSGSSMVVRALLYYRLALPPQLTRLENRPGTGVRILSATTAFRNEPFPTSGTCDSDTQADISEGKP